MTTPLREDTVVLSNKSTLCVLGYNLNLDLNFHFYNTFMEVQDIEEVRKAFVSEFTEKVKEELNDGFFYGEVDVLTENFKAFGKWRISRNLLNWMPKRSNWFRVIGKNNLTLTNFHRKSYYKI